MSSPWKQVSGRRLPALPGNSARYTFPSRSNTPSRGGDDRDDGIEISF